MSAWPGKYVIGLTGNIATGKSVVRRMLEHLGAYGIDADSLSHRTIARGAPGYQPVVEYFGRWVLDSEGQIDRSRLGRIVFSDPEQMRKLESIIHPLVLQAIDILIRRARHKVIVLEAIKLLEGNLHESCDSIWVTAASRRVQLARLQRHRRLSESEALTRINAQGPQRDKLSAAGVVIDNNGDFESTWNQVAAAWKKLVIGEEPRPEPDAVAEPGELQVERAQPRQASEIAAFVTRLSDGKREMSRNDVMAAFGEKAYMLLRHEAALVGLVGWQVENLITRTGDVFLEKDVPIPAAMQALMEQVEAASQELQSEVSLLFLPEALAAVEDAWKPLGYEPSSVEALNVRAWQEAARESQQAGAVMLFKQLRADRILRPI